MAHGFEPLFAPIIETAIVVHKAVGPGVLESIYAVVR